VPSLDQLQPGDLVFIPGSLGTPRVPRHVGLYLGHGLVVAAPKTGDVVRVSKLTTWAPKIAALRRIA
jgi:cell wall-associated NlpC family hydrolase